MKYLHLIWRNAVRNRLRTLLTMAGIAFLVFMMVFIATALTEMTAWQDVAAVYNRVVVQHDLGLATPLPIGHENYLKSDEIARHAEHVIKFNWVGAYWQDPKNWPASFAVDIEGYRKLFSELRISDEAFERLRKTKNGTLVGESLMRRYGWKVDGPLNMTGTFYDFNPELLIVGTFTAPDIRQEEMLFYRWDYFDEMTKNQKIVGTYWMKARTPDDVPRLKELIDGRFRNSSDPTETITEKEFANQFMQMMGNIRLMVIFICGAVLAMMVLMTANTMAMSVRERVTEIAVLRTLGFRSGQILSFIVLESVLVSMAATALALGAAFLIFNVFRLTPKDFEVYFPIFMVAPKTMLAAVAAALVCGVSSSIVPAVRASRRSIVDGLRQVV